MCVHSPYALEKSFFSLSFLDIFHLLEIWGLLEEANTDGGKGFFFNLPHKNIKKKKKCWGKVYLKHQC